MKKLIVYCCCGDCKTVLWESSWEHDVEGHTTIEGMGDSCDKCKQGGRFKPIHKPSNVVDFKRAMQDVKPIPKRGRGR